MLCFKKYIVLIFLCLNCNKCNSVNSNNIYDQIVNNVTVSKPDDDYRNMIKVTLWEEIHFKIIMANSASNYKNIDKVYLLYSIINCYISGNSINMIYQFIERFPLFYNNDKFLNTKHDNMFVRNIELQDRLIHINNDYIEFYFNILYKFINSIEQQSFFRKDDAVVLNALMSLQFKIGFILKKQFIAADIMIIQELFEVISVFHDFELKHCNIFMQPHIHNSKFYSYSTINETISEQLTSHIKSLLGLESYQHCSIDSIFLIHYIIPLSAEDNTIANDISNMKIKISKTDTVLIKNIWELFQQSYDIKFAYWYQKAVITAIMKLMCNKFLNIMKYSYHSSNEKTIENLNQYLTNLKIKINKEKNNLHPYFSGILNILNIEPFMGNIAYEEMKNLHDSLEINSEQFDEKFKDQDINEEQFMYDVDYLTTLIQKILNKFDDFKCFNQYFLYFKNEHDKYYLPFTFSRKNSKNVLPTNHSTCNFILHMYALAYKIKIYINMYMNYESRYPFLTDIALNEIERMKYYFIKIIDETNVQDLLKMSTNIVTILENMNVPFYFSTTNNIFNIEYDIDRSIKIIMAKLNTYGIQCSLSNSNYLLINNIDIYLFKEDTNTIILDDIENSITLKPIIMDFHGKQDYRCYNYKKMFDIIFTLQNYNDHFTEIYKNISLYWKGKYYNIQNIYNDIIVLFYNADYLYEFYNTFFTYIIAIVYYEIKYFYTLKKDSLVKKNNKNEEYYYLLNTILNKDWFPEGLWPLIENIKMCVTIDQFNNKQKNIEDQFNLLNIFFNNDGNKQPLPQGKPMLSVIAAMHNCYIALKLSPLL